MREVSKMRYYCDFCKKSAGQKAAMARHESGCTLNPNRKCGMCRHGNAAFPSLQELIAAAFNGLAALREVSGGCPACTLAGIRHARRRVGDIEDEDGRWTGPAAGAYQSLGAFNWKGAVKEFWLAHPRERDW